MWTRRSLPGRIIRAPLALIPPGAVLPMLHPRLLGMKWAVSSGPHGFWLGIYEPRVRRAFQRLVAPGDVLYDVGAHAGFYSLLGSRLVGGQGHVFSFEPDPVNYSRLEWHLHANRVSNVSPVRVAVASYEGTGVFVRGPDSSTGALADSEESEGFQVSLVSLDDFAQEHPSPTVIKMDIEGGELDALKGARGLLASSGPRIILSLHGAEQTLGCRAILQTNNYKLRQLSPDTILAAPTR
jgi:FkbM family methyltransferase